MIDLLGVSLEEEEEEVGIEERERERERLEGWVLLLCM